MNAVTAEKLRYEYGTCIWYLKSSDNLLYCARRFSRVWAAGNRLTSIHARSNGPL